MPFTRYVWPYPPQWNVLLVLIAGCVQFALVLYRKRSVRWMLPVLSAVGLLCAGVVLLTVSIPGVLFGEVYAAMTVALPGAAILVGAGIGELIAWIIKRP